MRAFELFESKTKPTLEEFLTGSLRNIYVFFKSSNGIEITSYVRKGPRHIKGIKFDKVLDRANTSVKNDKLQMKMYNANDTMMNTGAYREFDAYMLNLAKKYGYDGIYVESVLNDKLNAVLVRYGYELLSDTNPPSYWKKI